MDIKTRLDILEQIYKIYAQFTENLEVACRRYCSLCCTRNVTLTTIEGYKIADYIISNGKLELFEKFKTESHKKRFQPRLTTNKIAELCINGKDLPYEEISSFWGKCPVLINDECPIYPVRPFGCRCMISKKFCKETAEIDDFTLTVNNVFLQCLEQLDKNGFSGNLTDVMIIMASDKNRERYRADILKISENGLIPNSNITSLLIPPEYRVKINPILKSLQNINVQ